MPLHAVAHATWHTRECLWWRDFRHSHTNHSLAVARCCLRLHMQPGTLGSARGGMTSVMQGCTEACFRQGLLTPSMRLVSLAGCMIVIMRCASGLYAQGAECTKVYFGKAL